MRLRQTFWIVLPWHSNDDTSIDEYMGDPERVFYAECRAKVKYLDEYMDGYDKGEFPRIIKVMAEYYVTDVNPEQDTSMGEIKCLDM